MAVDEGTLRELTRRAIEELGPRATEENVKRLVNEAVARLKNGDGSTAEVIELASHKYHLPQAGTSNRIIVTAFGKNRVGIIAELTQALARHNCNLEDISQKLMQDYFAMIMIVEMPADASLGTIKEELAGVGNQLGVRILAQHEDVFTTMHRI